MSCGIYGYMMFPHLERHAEIRSIAQPSGIQAHLSVPALDMGTTCGNTVKASGLAMVCSLFLASTGVGPVLCCMVNMPLRRVSGNVVNDFVLGSITSAVQVYGVRLICGAGAHTAAAWWPEPSSTGPSMSTRRLRRPSVPPQTRLDHCRCHCLKMCKWSVLHGGQDALERRHGCMFPVSPGIACLASIL